MILASFTIKLVLVVCMNADCSTDNAYEVDTFTGPEYFDVLDDCTTPRNAGNAAYKRLPDMRAELHCWTPAELHEKGYN